MLSNIYLLKFNNYYNRQLKIYNDLATYQSFMCNGILSQNPLTRVNFIPSDGVNTTQVINWDGETPDYLLVCEDRTIISRWFIIDAVRNLKGQFELTLHRDLIADYYDSIVDAPMFIEKGFVPMSDSTFFNKESITTSQVKTYESLLKDNTGAAWVVGYCDKDFNDSIEYGSIPVPDIVVEEAEDWEFYEYTEQDVPIALNPRAVVRMRYNQYSSFGSTSYNYIMEANCGTADCQLSYETGTTTGIVVSNTINDTEEQNELFNALRRLRTTGSMSAIAYTQFSYLNNDAAALRKVRKVNNKIIQIGTESPKYYKVIVNGTDEYGTGRHDVLQGTNLYNAYKNGLIPQIASVIDSGEPDNNTFKVEFDIYEVSIFLRPLDYLSGLTLTLNRTRPLLNDAPYCMFCIPYGDEYFYTKDGTVHQTIPINAMTLAAGIATAMGGTGTSHIYDVQLLPYCPISYVREQGRNINLDDTHSGLQYQVVSDASQIIFWATESTGSFNITYNYYVGANPVRDKIYSQTRNFRICSPNYNGVFEFNPIKNYGTSFINVDYTYKPHQPYIHLNPDFKGMYGGDYNDARGLICGGDFSLPIVDDAWIDYQISNKNYQQIFNRQIESMELQHQIQAEKDEINALTGTLTGALGGAVTGGMAGGAYGAVAGFAAGGVASAWGGLKDIQFNKALRRDALDSAQDMFGYQLGNVKALPDSLTRVSAYNANNKIFPFMEYYDCTEAEYNALKDKITYNGMTIMKIGTLAQSIVNKPETISWGFHKGQIIRFEDLGDDFHVANEINNELNKGVYII